MKTLMKKILPVAMLGLGMMSIANAQTTKQQVLDPEKAVQMTVSKRTVNYQCGGNKLQVLYGFNKQGLPTYAHASLNGKKRFMPVNLARTNSADLIFGDENNFSITTSPFTVKTYKKQPLLVMSPSSEVIFKSCTPKR